MYRLIIWGIGAFYDNYIARYLLNEKINVVGFVTGLDTVCKELDGKPVLAPDEIKGIDFDFIIIAVTDQELFRNIRKRIVEEYHVSERKCINGKVFKHPCFNWERYMKILDNPPTLITEACYGGYIYNQLGMEFFSPFINTRISQTDYLKLISNIDYYLAQNLCADSDIQKVEDMYAKIGGEVISWRKMGYPTAMLGDVKLHAIHAENLNSYIDDWNRRKKRINWDNIWILMIIENEEILEKFKAVKYEKKIGFYYRETDCKQVVSLNDWGNFSSRLKSLHDFLSYVHHQIWDEKIFRAIDIFKMLSGEREFIRMM